MVPSSSPTQSKEYSIEEQEDGPPLAGPESAWAQQPGMGLPACSSPGGVKAGGQVHTPASRPASTKIDKLLGWFDPHPTKASRINATFTSLVMAGW
jgi:hypothetical protein